MTLEEVTQFVDAKDSGKRSASRLLDSQVVQAASSSYKKTKQTAVTVRDKNEICSYCGKNVLARLRKSDCSAYGHKCGYCAMNTTLKRSVGVKRNTKLG
jgi:hypothetical protein